MKSGRAVGLVPTRHVRGDMEKQTALAYATPIGRFKVPNADAVNQALRRVILERERSEPSSDYANVGGWHSRHDLLDWPVPEIGVLRGWIGEAVQHMVATATEGKPVHGAIGIVAWANVARAGHYHRVHNHPSSAWSGFYYVEGERPTPAHPLAECLDLRPAIVHRDGCHPRKPVWQTGHIPARTRDDGVIPELDLPLRQSGDRTGRKNIDRLQCSLARPCRGLIIEAIGTTCLTRPNDNVVRLAQADSRRYGREPARSTVYGSAGCLT